MSGTEIPPTLKEKPLYFPLTIESKEIRVLLIHSSQDSSAQVHCSLQCVSLTDSKRAPYQALSYVWGDPKITVPIWVDGREVQVTTNLDAALRRVRDTTPDQTIHLWVDAVCIDQNNLVDRSQQVQLMADIYRGAEKVIVWLGEASEEDNSNLGMDKCADWGSHHQDRDSRYLLDEEVWMGKFDASNWEAVGKILARPYWQRRWIYQEVLLARDAVVMCGPRVTPWKNFVGLQMAIYQVSRKLDMIPPDRWAIMEGAKLSTMKTFMPAEEGDDRRLLNLLKNTSQMDCLDKRDHLYSLLGLASDAGSYPIPDYTKSVTEVYTSFARAHIESTKTLDILHEAACRLSSRQYLLLGFPWWVPDWRLKPFGDVQLSRFPFDACAGLDAYAGTAEPDDLFAFEFGQLQLHSCGVHCDTISHVAPNSMETLRLPDLLDFLQSAVQGKPHPTGLPLLKVLHYTLNLDFDYRLYERLSFIESAKPGETLAQDQLSKGFLLFLACQYGYFHDMLFPGQTLSGDPDLDIDYQFAPEDSELARQFPQLVSFKAFLASMQKEREFKGLYTGLLNQVGGHLRDNTEGRRLFVTEKGYFGLAQPGFQKGDSIVVLFGCKTPVILRPDFKVYEFVDDCFVYGLMDGEIIQMVSMESEDGSFVDYQKFIIE